MGSLTQINRVLTKNNDAATVQLNVAEACPSQFYKLGTWAVKVAVLGISCMATLAYADIVYVTNSTSNNVSAIDTNGNKVVATIPVTNPMCATLNPTGTMLYVCSYSADKVNVINTSTNTIAATIPVQFRPAHAAINPMGTRLYVVNKSAHTVSVIDTTNNTVLATIPVGQTPIWVTVNSAGTYAYVSNAMSDTVSVISTSSNSVVSTIPVGKYPDGIVVSPDGKRLYVANQASSTVSVIDTQTNASVATIPVGWNSTGVTINSTGTKVYVTNMGGSNSVSVIDTSTNTATVEIPVDIYPIGLVVTSDDKFIYVANYGGGGGRWGGDGTTVSVIDATTNKVVATVTVGIGPSDVAIKKTIQCPNEHAVFDPKTGIVNIPAIDIPTLDPFTGESTGKFTVAKAQLSLFKGVEDFAFLNNSFSIIGTDVPAAYACHAQYTYADGKFSKGGTIQLPYVDVPSVIVIPPNVQIPGPTQVYDATLRQLALDALIFHLADYKLLGTLKP